eukprot:gb/GECG01012834.1/.p1 GENE.gb/GECG01012834.1/~~gb/GECG01012834.1/.p1  ORF type:complete len:153 (+),score=19.75 gb/GECG01012834.1/:1-459(+)
MGTTTDDKASAAAPETPEVHKKKKQKKTPSSSSSKKSEENQDQDGQEDEPTVVSSSAFLCAIARPLAGKKLHKKIYKAVKKGSLVRVAAAYDGNPMYCVIDSTFPFCSCHGKTSKTRSKRSGESYQKGGSRIGGCRWGYITIRCYIASACLL